MTIFLKPNLKKQDFLPCLRGAAETLGALGFRLLIDEADKTVVGDLPGCEFGDPVRCLDRCDVVMPIGGDGTIMRSARQAALAGKPVIGLNAGRVGFLAQAEMNEIGELERLLSGRYRIVERMMLLGAIESGSGRSEFTALNDVVARHGDSDRIVELEVRQGDRLIASYRADGVIFSTPTGSTAYSVSAGGPIVPPEMRLILLTAICPHAAFHSSLVLPPEGSYTASEKPGSTGNGLNISADGERAGCLQPGESLTVSRAGFSAKFIDLGLRDFYGSLMYKLNWRR